MRDDFGALWAASPSSQRRGPTAAELASGLPCGGADRQLFNEIFFTISSLLAECNGVLDLAGIAPNPGVTSQLSAALQTLIPRQITAQKTPYNLKQFQNPVRVSLSGGGAGVPVSAWGSISYAKKSPTSLILVWGTFTTRSPFAPGQGASAALVNLNVGTTTAQFATTNSYPGQALQNNFVQVLTGVGSGDQPISLTFQRPDAATWSMVFNPTTIDESTFPASTTATLVFVEVEP